MARRGRSEKKKEVEKQAIVWDKEAIQKYRETTEEIRERENQEEESVEGRWKIGRAKKEEYLEERRKMKDC